MKWWYCLGGITASLFVVQGITGIMLAFYYKPSAAEAYNSILFIENEVRFGAAIRMIHHWAANGMIVMCMAHMLRVFIMGAYKKPREMNWVSGVLLLVLTLAFGFTGYLLPWDQRAFWATTVGTEIAGPIPVIGNLALVFLRVGWEVGGQTLSRFDALHLRVGRGPLPVFVAGGVPAVAEAAGARVLALLRALSSHLAAEALAEVLPALRLDGDDRNHLTHGEAMELAYGLGTVGGNAAHPEGALAWSVRAEARLAELEAALRHARADEDSAAREVRRLERTLESLRAVRPALDALVGVARAVVRGAPLSATFSPGARGLGTSTTTDRSGAGAARPRSFPAISTTQ